MFQLSVQDIHPGEQAGSKEEAIRQIAAAPPCTQKSPADALPETNGEKIFRAICEELDARQG